MATEPLVAKGWICRIDESLGWHPHSVALEALPDNRIIAAWSATPAADTGECHQIRISLSYDGGQNWAPSSCAMYGLGLLWSPVLFYDPSTTKANSAYQGLPGQARPAIAAEGRLLLFYSESRKVPCPGGDLKLIESLDFGATWGPPLTLLSHEAEGGIPKILGGRVVETRAGAWVLPFSRVAVASSAASARPVPPDAAPDRGVASAGVLTSNDRGRCWRACGQMRAEEGDAYIGGSVVELAPRPGSPLESRLLMTARSIVSGLAYQAISRNGGETWKDIKLARFQAAEGISPEASGQEPGTPSPYPLTFYAHCRFSGSSDLLAVCCAPATMLVAGGAVLTKNIGPEMQPHVVLSNDEGQTWNPCIAPTPEPLLEDVDCSPAGVLVVAADSGVRSLLVGISIEGTGLQLYQTGI